MTLPPERIGYKGQPFRLVVDQTLPSGHVEKLTIGWAAKKDMLGIDGLNTRPGWANARYEDVLDTDPEVVVWKKYTQRMRRHRG